MTTVLLIRHGRTQANARGILAGRAPGVHLDGTGRRTARALGTRLREVPFDVVVHSPLDRCVETAALLLAQRGGAPVAMRADDRLVECDYGSWSGRALADLARDPLWAQVQTRPSQVRFPDGEAMADMATRAVAGVRDWAAEHPDGVVAVVSHGDLIKAVLSEALAQPFDEFQRLVVAPGSLSVVVYGPQRTAVLSMNDTGRVRLPGAGAARPTVGGGAG